MSASLPPLQPGQTLPDLLKPGLKLIFVGINPGYYSAQVGHYYARPGNLFWWGLSNSGLINKTLLPQDDEALLDLGIGFTDIVKRPTNSSGELRQDEFDAGVKEVSQKILKYAPKTACFVGILGAATLVRHRVIPGPLKETIGSTRLFAIPSPSRRNAHYGQDKILSYFQQLANYVISV